MAKRKTRRARRAKRTRRTAWPRKARTLTPLMVGVILLIAIVLGYFMTTALFVFQIGTADSPFESPFIAPREVSISINKPDLAVGSVLLDEGTLTVNINNKGNAAATITDAHILVGIDELCVSDEGRCVSPAGRSVRCEDVVPGSVCGVRYYCTCVLPTDRIFAQTIGPGESISIDYPGMTVLEDITVKVTLDPENLIGESDETNNELEQNFAPEAFPEEVPE